MTDNNPHAERPDKEKINPEKGENPEEPVAADAASEPQEDTFFDVALEELGESEKERAFLDTVHQALKQDDVNAVQELVADMHAADLAGFMALLSSRNRRRFIEFMGQDIDPELFYEVEGIVQQDLYEAAPNDVIANAITELDTDDAVYIIDDLDAEDRAEVLKKLPASERRAIEEGLSYPEYSAGRLMQRELVSLPEFWSVGQTIDFLRQEKENLPEDFYDLFVVDPLYHLVGVVALSTVMRSHRSVKIADIMSRDFQRVIVTDDQEDVAHDFSKYHLISAAVVDENNRIMGVITADDVMEVVGDEAGEDILALAGVGEASMNESFRETTRGRFAWLFVNLLTAILASVVIGQFDATIAQMVPLAILMPIVASMGGNAGTQTMTVAVRALATKELTSTNLRRVLTREVGMALVNGLILSLSAGLVAFLWFSDTMLAVIFSVGMIINMLTAGFMGLLIPVGLNRFGVDPAISSSVFVTTITDVVGFLAFLGLAALFLL